MINIAVYGRGNVSMQACKAVMNASDMSLAGIVRRTEAGGDDPPGIKVTADIRSLLPVDTAVIGRPSRNVPQTAAELAALGINTVDSYDIHSSIFDYLTEQDALCRLHGTVSIIAAGWDPGFDSALRIYYEAMAPAGQTFTNFGPGMSMGHSVAARAVEGVKDAVSFTLPAGKGKHTRRVLIEVNDGYDFDAVSAAIRTDGYFSHDETTVTLVENVKDAVDYNHGVLLEREGASSGTEGQKFSFSMRVNNPALTAQIMVSCARAASRLSPGCYTVADIPPAFLLPGSREDIIRRLV